MIVGDTADEVMAAVGDGSSFGAKITYIPQDAPLGLAHCVLDRPRLPRRRRLRDVPRRQPARAGPRAPSSTRSRRPAPSAEPAGGADPAEAGSRSAPVRHRQPRRHGNVVHLVEKPEDPPTDLALVGVYLFDRMDPRRAVRSIAPSARGELEITDAIQWLIDHGHRVRTELLTGWWIDTGKLTPLLEANRLLLETLEPGDRRRRRRATPASTAGSSSRPARRSSARRIRGPVAIAAGATIEDSFIGPFTAIGDRLRGRQLRDRALGRDGRSRILDIPRLEDSLIGKGGRGHPLPGAAPRAAADGRRPLPDRRGVTRGAR